MAEAAVGDVSVPQLTPGVSIGYKPRRILDKHGDDYKAQLRAQQLALVQLQYQVQEQGLRIVVLFEGRDAAGKSGAIRRVTEHLNPRGYRVVALPIADSHEQTRWYLQRYVRELPRAGECVFFDRSWYNRAIVEPVNGLCTHEQSQQFMRQVPLFEDMLVNDGMVLVKLWFALDRDEQAKRIMARIEDPIKSWKVTPIDLAALDKWDTYTRYEQAMFYATDTVWAPWTRIDANDKHQARLDAMNVILGAVHARLPQAAPARAPLRAPLPTRSVHKRVVKATSSAERERELALALVTALGTLATGLDRVRLGQLLTAGDVAGAEQLVRQQWASQGTLALEEAMTPLLEATSLAAAAAITATDTLVVGAAVQADITTRLAMIETATADAIAGIVQRAAASGLPVSAQVSEIQRLVGLTDRQALTVANFRAGLEEAGMPLSRIESLLEQRINALKVQRADLITSTETTRLWALGQRVAWELAADAGTLDLTQYVQEWVVTEDERLCEICAAIPGMNPDGRGLDELFATPVGDLDMPPAHPACRCDLVLRSV